MPDAEWINAEAVSKSNKLGGTDTTAQVHPRLLTQLLAKEVGNTVIAEAESIEYATDLGGKPKAVLAKSLDGKEVRLECTDVVLATGPWSGKLMKKLFENDPSISIEDYDIRGSRAHSVRIWLLAMNRCGPYYHLPFKGL